MPAQRASIDGIRELILKAQSEEDLLKAELRIQALVEPEHVRNDLLEEVSHQRDLLRKHRVAA